MIIGKSLETCFAPPERLSFDAVMEQYDVVSEEVRLKELLDSIPDLVLILNSYRQIVFANGNMLRFLNQDDCRKIIGMRPGELFDCIHSSEKEGGCGTTEFCSECGAVKTILAGFRQEIQVQECSITVNEGKTYNFRVWSSLHCYEKENYVFFIIRDISEEKFRHALERTFFHDIANTASGLYGLTSIINSSDSFREHFSLLFRLCQELVEEIDGHRDIMRAEEGAIIIHQDRVNSLDIIKKLVQFYENQLIAQGIAVIISENTAEACFKTDESLLRRVLGNMIKNALEACSEGQQVIVTCKQEGGKIIFSTHNPNYIPRNIRLNIFKRSFSTKGAGRGWGIYGMKLLTEKYLGGRVSFCSTEEGGTTFFVELPLNGKDLNSPEQDTAENAKQGENTEQI